MSTAKENSSSNIQLNTIVETIKKNNIRPTKKTTRSNYDMTASANEIIRAKQYQQPKHSQQYETQ